ncbi:hypothetical protein OG589_05495 [Sphaerisporangium sp. NBC_01403]|uniref:hypothetical protein n=1 Tax=Sphaerisporangium sp. NBC_01403 TaxID=2903599 RepID=UPI00324B5CB7
MAPLFGQVTSRLPAGFSEHESRLLTGMLRRMLDNLRAGTEGPAPAPPGEGRAHT